MIWVYRRFRAPYRLLHCSNTCGNHLASYQLSVFYGTSCPTSALLPALRNGLRRHGSGGSNRKKALAPLKVLLLPFRSLLILRQGKTSRISIPIVHLFFLIRTCASQGGPLGPVSDKFKLFHHFLSHVPQHQQRSRLAPHPFFFFSYSSPCLLHKISTGT